MDATTAFLGVIALATLVMAAVQVGIVVYGARMAQRVDRLATQVEQELKPTLTRVNAMSADVHRATTLASAQVERTEHVVTRVVDRMDRATLALHDAIVEPIRHGAALWDGIAAALDVLRTGERRPTRETRPEPVSSSEERPAS